MAKYGMAIDLSKCLGCGACAMACKTENNTEFEQDGRRYNWADFLVSNEGTFADGNLKKTVLPVLCNHCTSPYCIRVCPTTPKALYKTEDGITMRDQAQCIGCQKCQNACPYSTKDTKGDGVQYSVLTYNPKAHNTQTFYDDDSAIIPGCSSTPAETAGLAGITPPDKNDYTHPNYSPVRLADTVEKCTFCHHRLVNGDDPYCVVSCPSGARIFGDLDDPESEISKLLAAQGYKRLADNAGNMLPPNNPGSDPNVYYVGDFNPGQ